MFGKFDNKVAQNDALLADVLTSGSPSIRLLGRLAATGAGDVMANWVNAELERGTAPTEILRILANFQVQVFASVAGALVQPRGFKPVEELFHETLEAKFQSHAMTTFELRNAGAFKNTEQAE